MPGLATRLLIAERVLDRLKTEDADLFATLSEPTNRTWYMFGALGPAIGDFVPFEPGGLGSPFAPSPYFSIWKLVLEIAVGNSTTTPPLPGLVPTLATLTQIMNQLNTLVNNQDFSGMEALSNSGALNKVNQASNDLITILNFFSQPLNLVPISNLICPNSEPAIDNSMRVVPPVQWTGRDWLHWKHPGKFAAALRAAASSSGDSRFIAYATGWEVAYAGLVCSSGFMNSITGSCYRTYWWRSRWMEMFVDTWAWGFYNAPATMKDDVPNPPYSQWPSLCAAALQTWIDVGIGLDPASVAETVVTGQPLPQPLPADFVTFWLNAWNSAYLSPTPSLFTADRIQAGYLMTWLVLWFQTSGAVVGCNPPPSSNPPSTCGSNPQPPNWIDPTKTNPVTGKPFQPQQPTPTHDPNVGETICGVILTLLGLGAEFFGGTILGGAAIAGGVSLIVNGEEELNWDQLNCQLYWLSLYMFNGLTALHNLTVVAGLQHPSPAELAAMSDQLDFGSITIPFPTAASMCQSQLLSATLVPWGCGAFDWTNYPQNVAAETPGAMVWKWPRWWPSAFIDDATVNPGGSDITVAPPAYNVGVTESFGPSVQAAIKLITNSSATLPDWNLDGDRGLGWLTWELTAPYTSSPQTQAEP